MKVLKVMGYSERGVVNALVHELKDQGSQTLVQLLSRVNWPFMKGPNLCQSTSITVLVEQSLSDFGDADLIFLWVNQDDHDKGTIFCEVKRGIHWKLDKQWSDFRNKVDGKDSRVSSNLFGQLYLKMCYVQAVKQGILESGVQLVPPFHKGKGGAVRRIGDNSVVRRVSENISRHLANVHYLIIAPEDYGREVYEALSDVRQYEKAPHYWDYSNAGYLSWREIAEFAEEHNLEHSQEVLRYNRGQIY